MGIVLLKRIDSIIKGFLTTLAECAKGASYAINH
jgi:hypothetical protein